MDIIFNISNICKQSSVFKAYSRLAKILTNNQPKVFDSYGDWIKGSDYVVCANIWQVLKTRLYLIGSRTKIIFWIQGLVAEESLLKNNSKTRFFLLKLIEKICLFFSDAYIYVSPYMRDYYSKISFVKHKPSLIIPCISDLNYVRIKKTPYSFCYLGGMSKWQNFPQIIEMMSRIDKKHPHSIFKIATNEVDICRKTILQYGSQDLINKIQVTSLSSKEEVENFLEDCEYGFLIRDDILVNHVSSPIKMAEYLSCGVNVISTSAIRSYSSLLGEAGLIIDSIDDIDKFEFKANESAALEIYNKFFSNHAVELETKEFLEVLRKTNV